MQHHSHPVRPPHITHHVHQQQMHATHPTPAQLGMNMAQSMGPPPTQQQALPQHHMANVPPPHGGEPQPRVYIPSKPRDAHRFTHHPPQQAHQQHQRVNPQQLHQTQQMQANKIRPNHTMPGGMNHQPKGQMQNNANKILQQLQPHIHQQQPPSTTHQQQHKKPLQTHALSHHIPVGLHNKTHSHSVSHQSRPAHTQPTPQLSQQQTQQVNQQPKSSNQVQKKATPPQAQQTPIVSNPKYVNFNNNTIPQQAIVQTGNNKSTVANRVQRSATIDPAPVTTENAPQSTQNNSKDDNNIPVNSLLDPNANEGNSSTKEKTPMCLVNELARYNKIQHQYHLTGEQGPAHCKRFTVTLKLGDEEYIAEGHSIKKAQHTAAADAVSKTKYEHPPPKLLRMKNGSRAGVSTITPTVELNALAMKLGQPTVYVFDSPNQPIVYGNNHLPPQMGGHPPPAHMPPNINYMGPPPGVPPNYIQEGHFNGTFHRNTYANGRFQGPPGRKPFSRLHPQQRMGVPFPGIGLGPKDACKITLIVGEQKFVGIGPTVQLAKHDAATRALEVLKPLANSAENNDSHNSSLDDSHSDLKSPISLVHEIALRRNLSVSFEVKSEVGPPHMKTFITICRVGTMMTEGEGNGKKISKKRAAERMLEELKKLPPLSPSKISLDSVNKIKNFKKTTKPPTVKKKARNIIKEKSDSEVPEEVNPISKLIQIQQSMKEKEPVYRVIEEKGAPRRREFVIEVEVRGQTATGHGSNKKTAKKNAAKNLLTLMGYDTPCSPDKENDSTVANGEVKSEPVRKVKFADGALRKSKNQPTTEMNEMPAEGENVEASECTSQGPACGRQIVPGVLVVPAPINHDSPKCDQTTMKDENTSSVEEHEKSLPAENETKEMPAAISNSAVSSDVVRPKDQLLYLAQLMDYNAKFTDYPKGNHGDFLTIVTLATEPPLISHGQGPDTETSQDQAASSALEMLSKLGLDNVKPKKQQQDVNQAPEAPASVVAETSPKET